MSITDKLQQLDIIKADIKTAINNKGGNVGDDFTTYATAIENIEGGTGGKGYFEITNDISLAFSEFTEVPDNIQLSDDCTKAKNLFRNCEKLTTLPEWDFSNINNMYSMCRSCKALLDVPPIDCSAAKDTQYMFSECTKLEMVPFLDISNSTNCQYMFNGCTKLVSAHLDLSNSTNCQYMFYGCENLNDVDLINTSNVTTFSNCFSNSAKTSYFQLYRIGEIDCSSVTTGGTSNMFLYQKGIVEMGALKNLGMGFEKLGKAFSFNLSYPSNLSTESLINIVSGLADVNGILNGYTCTLNITNSLVSNIPEDIIAIATNKGWTIA